MVILGTETVPKTEEAHQTGFVAGLTPGMSRPGLTRLWNSTRTGSARCGYQIAA